MKILTTNGLTKLIQLVKSTFIPKVDVVEASELNVDTTPTQSSSNLITSGAVYAGLSEKQASLVSGTNIKSINSSTILDSGNIDLQIPLVSGTNIKSINSSTILGSGNIDLQTPIQVVNSLPANPDANTWYAIPES